MIIIDWINKIKYQMLAKIQLQWQNWGGSDLYISAKKPSGHKFQPTYRRAPSGFAGPYQRGYVMCMCDNVYLKILSMYVNELQFPAVCCHFQNTITYLLKCLRLSVDSRCSLLQTSSSCWTSTNYRSTSWINDFFIIFKIHYWTNCVTSYNDNTLQ